MSHQCPGCRACPWMLLSCEDWITAIIGYFAWSPSNLCETFAGCAYNTSAHLVTGTRRFDHNTSVLNSLHWQSYTTIAWNTRCVYWPTLGYLPMSAWFCSWLPSQFYQTCSSCPRSSFTSLGLSWGSAPHDIGGSAPPRVLTKTFGNRSFTYAGLSAWNALLITLRHSLKSMHIIIGPIS